uniref:Putative tick ixostatin n=1 Tax=Ixodes ricinus TaxID=34613 RepID=V5H1V8_IXORI
MQLVLFIVIVTFTPLSCEVQSESIPVIYKEFEDLPPECQNNQKNQMERRCSEDSYHPRLLKVSKCEFKCGDEHNNGRTMGTHGQSFILKDGTPCGQNEVCIDGICTDRCSMPIVKMLKRAKIASLQT